MHRRLAALCSVLLAIALVVAGCGGSSNGGKAPAETPAPSQSTPEKPAEKPKDPVTLQVWSWRAQDKDLWAKVEENLKAAGEPITIEFRGVKSTDYDSVLQTAMAGGEGPDIFTTRAGAGTRKYAEANQILSLESLKFDGFDKSTLSQVSHEDKVFAVPFAVQTLTFFYNKAIFDEHGLKEPATWDELITIMDTLQSKGITPFAMGGKDGYALGLIVDTLGATHLGDEWATDAIAGKTNFADPKFVDVLTRINTLRKYSQQDIVATAQRDARALFGTGQTAMMIDGIWAVETYYLQTDPDMQLGSFLAPPLKAGDPVRQYAYVDGGYAVNAQSKAKDAAMTVAAYVAGAEFAQMYADMHAEIPGNSNVSFPDNKPMLKKAVELRKSNPLNVLFRIRSPFDSGSPDISTSLGANIQGMLSDKITPQQAAEAVQKDLASWYPAFKQ